MALTKFAIRLFFSACFGLLVLGTIPGAWAQECTQACADKYVADTTACQQTLDARLAELDREAAACLNKPDPIQVGLCVRNVNVKRSAARRSYTACVSKANSDAFNCYRACTLTETTP